MEEAPASAAGDGAAAHVAPTAVVPAPPRDEPAIAPFLSKLYQIVSLASLREIISW